MMASNTPAPVAPSCHAGMTFSWEGPVDRRYSLVSNTAAGVGVGLGVGVGVGAGVGAGVGVGEELTPPLSPQPCKASTKASADARNIAFPDPNAELCATMPTSFLSRA